MRRKKFTKLIASMLAVSLTLGACPITSHLISERVAAAETWETVKEWKFNGSDTEGWNAYAYQSTAASTSLSLVDGKLKVESDFSEIGGDPSNWNPGGVSGGLIPIGVNGEARLTFDLYCKQGDALPSHIQLNTAWSDWSNGNYPSKSWGEVVTESNETATIEGNTYDKYQVEFPLTNLTTNDNLTNLLLIRSDRSFNGTVYLDNIVLQKKKETEGGGTTGVVYEDAGPVVLDTTDSSSNWPSAQFNVSGASGVTLPVGTVLQYDMEIADGKSFTDLVWGTKIGWEAPGADENYAWNRTLASTDFTDSKRTEQITLDKEYKLNDSDANKWGVQVWVNQRTIDDVGVVTCSALKITLPAQSENDPATDGLKETVLYRGEKELAKDAYEECTPGELDMSQLSENGYFRVEYTSTQEASVGLVFKYYTSAEDNAWVSFGPSNTGTVDGAANTYFAEYSYQTCKGAWETNVQNKDKTDLSNVQNICVQNWSGNSITLKSLKWCEIQSNPAEDPALPETVLFDSATSGDKTATGHQAQLFYLYTKHVGGTFDASKINYGSYFEATHTGDEGKLILALASNSGATNWIAVTPSETVRNSDDTYTSKFKIEDCIDGNAVWGGFGTNFKRLDQIQVHTYGGPDEGTVSTITLKSLKYCPGTGDIIDPNGETKWTNKKKKGIALIGDSIVHNPLVYTVTDPDTGLGKYTLGDWNAILGRSDCSNWGIGGQTTVHIANRIDDMLAYDYDTIVIWCGINDLGAGVSEDQTIQNYETMYKKVKEQRPNAKVISISVLPTTDRWYPGDGSSRIQSINTRLKALTEQEEYKDFVAYVDCYSDLVDASTGYANDKLFLDGLHPNEAGYTLVANKLKSLLPEEVIDENEEPEVIEINETKAISVTNDTVNNWPYVEYPIADSGIIYTGTTVEYDLTVDNKDFTGIYLETDFNWEKVKTMTLTPADFGDSMTKHITATYVGENINKLTGCQIKTGGDGTTYRGNLTCSNLKITPAKPETPAGGDESALEETVLFSGSDQIGKIDNKDVLKEVYTSGNFNMSRVMPGGYFYVEYQAAQKEKVILAFNDWEGGSDGWKEISTTESGKVSDGIYYAKFSYQACENALGSKNFSIVDAVNVKVPEAVVTITSLKWRGPKLPSNGNSGSSSDSSTESNTNTDKNKDQDKDTGNKDKDDSGNKAPVITQGQGQNHSVSGQDFVVTKGGEDGKAEVAFMEAPANAKKVVIPKTVVIDGVTCNVTSIAAEAFKGNTKITSVTIGSNIKKIGDEAFAGCTSLTKVVVPTSVTEIGEKAFYGCKKVQTVTIGKNVKTIEESAFEKCTSLKIVAISDSVEKIESKAFNGCKNLKKIKITSTNLKSVGSNALNGLNKNAVIDVPDNMLKAYKKLFTAKTGFKKTMKLV